MKAVLHRPVAEQYPSNTAHVSCLASNRISGMAATEKSRPREAGKSPRDQTGNAGTGGDRKQPVQNVGRKDGLLLRRMGNKRCSRVGAHFDHSQVAQAISPWSANAAGKERKDQFCAHADTFRLSAGRIARSLPPVISSAWYCRPLERQFCPLANTGRIDAKATSNLGPGTKLVYEVL